MKSKIITLGIIFIITTNAVLFAQYEKQDTSYKDCFVGTTMFMLGNFLPTNKPDFVQLNLGYRVTGKDVVSLELKTWKYGWSLGIPYGDSYESPSEQFPGYIREYGFAFAYQRYLWKGLYTSLHVMNAWQSFVNNEGKQIDRGFQIFNTYRLGYHVKLFNDLFFIEPSIAITHRPYHSKMPHVFREMDQQWKKYFIGEPGLHVGFNF